MVDTFRAVKDRPLASAFLGSTAGMITYADARWVWFADGFDPASYGSVTVATPRNGMGRSHVVGDAPLQAGVIAGLGRVKAWKKAVGEGTGGDLVVYLNLRAQNVTGLGVEQLVELVAVDGAGQVQARVQTLGGSSGLGGLILGGAGAGLLGVAAALPSEGDQYEFFPIAAASSAERLCGAFTTFARDQKKDRAPANGAAFPLSGDAADYAGGQPEQMGEALAAQVGELIAVVSDGGADEDARGKAARDLGHIGSEAMLAPFGALLADAKALPKALREHLTWALGDLGHPDGAPMLESAAGLPGKAKKFALAKIAEL